MWKASRSYLFCILLTTAWAVAQTPTREHGAGDRVPRQASPVREFAEVSLIEVPVNVLGRDGKPVPGLTISDFEVEEDGKKQPILSLDVVDLNQRRLSEGERVPLAAAARRHLLLLFDLSFADSNEILRSRNAAIRFIQSGLDPDDLVAVASTSVERGVRLQLTFTSDRRQVVDAIGAVGLPKDADRAKDSLAFVFSGPGEPISSSSSGEQTKSNATMLDPASAARIYAAMLQKNEDDHEVTRVGRHLGDMSALASALDAVGGRKTIIYFSEGFDARLLLGSIARQQSAEQTRADNDAMFSGMFWTFDVDRRYADSPLRRELNETISLFQRSDCVVYPIDISGLKAEGDSNLGSSHHGEESLFAFASGTGGEVIRNTNDFDTQMRRVEEKTSLTYVLSYRSPDPGEDGKFHSLRVRVKAKGARVSARAGYYAAKSFPSLSPLERSLAAADVITHEKEKGDFPIDVAVVSLFENRIGRVPVLIQIPGGVLPQPVPPERLSLGIYVYATDESGRFADYFTRVVTLDPAKEGEQFARAGLTFYGTCHLLPGRYRVRAYVRDEHGGRFGFRVAAIEVPDFAAETMHAVPPLFVSDDVAGLRLKDSSGLVTEPEPFRVGDTTFLPEIAPKISAGGHSRICLMVYRKASDGAFAPLQIDGQIVDTQGRLIGPAKLSLIGRTAPSAEGLVKLLLDFAAGDLPAGEYTLRVLFRDSQDQTRRTESESPVPDFVIRRPPAFRNFSIARITLSLALAVLLVRAFPAAGAQDPRRELAELRREMSGAHPPAASQVSSRLNDIGVEYLEAGDPARAIELLSEAAGQDPDNGVALANLILAYLKHEDFEFAEFYLDRATESVERHNPDPRIYSLIGELYAMHNRLEEALSAWDYYHRLGGSDPDALARLERTRQELSIARGQRLLESDHFRLYTDETISAEDATQAEAYLEEAYRSHSAFFATELPGPQVVILYGGRSYFSLVSVPDWVSGVFDGKIRVSLDPDRGVTPQLQNVLSHELAHAMIRFASRDRAPGWLQEGLAQWCEGRRILRRELREVSRGRFAESIAALESRFGHAADRAAARSSYAQALGLVEYLIARHGSGAVVCLLQRLGEGLSLPAALRAEIGLTPEQLLAGWRSWAGL